MFSLRSDCAATNALLMNNIGKDLSAEMNNIQHRPALDYISSHLRVGKFASNDNEEKVILKQNSPNCKIHISSNFYSFVELNKSDIGINTS